MRETILLEEDDSIAVVRYKLEQAQSRRVALVAPPDGWLLRSEVNLSLIRRAAEGLGLDLVLVTADSRVATRARAAGLKTAPTARSAQHARSRLPVASETSRAVPTTVPYASLLKPGSIAATLGRELPAARPKWALLAVACAAVLLGLVGLGLAVPGATVVLDPKGTRADAELEVLANTGVQEVDFDQAQVPARLVQIEAGSEEEGQTTGKQSIPDQHATGEVVFANKSTEEITVSKGTVVRTDDGVPVRFYTLLDVGVPGSYGATARAPIMAFEPGPAGNVDALTIRVVEGEPSFHVEVLNDQPVRGGSDKRVGIVAREDCDRLRASLMQRLQQQAYDLLVQQLAKGEWIPPDTLEVAIVDESFDKKVDEAADMLRLTMKVSVSGVAVEGEATRQLMAYVLEARSGEGRVVNKATLQVEQPAGREAVDGQTVRFTARATALLVKPVDLRALKTRLAGQDPKAALAWLAKEYDLRRPPEIRREPDWWPRLPWLASRIRVELSGGL